MSDYHGPKPVTADDFKMAKKHLKATYKLNKQKIKDHKKALKDSEGSKSADYNHSHLQGHQTDNAKIQQSMSTLENLQPMYNKVKGDNMATKFNTKKTGSYKGQSNAAGGGGRFKQMTDNGVSPGLAAYIGRKKFGAGRMAKMAAKGNKGS